MEIEDTGSKPKRKTTRRSISVCKTTYDKLKAYCEANKLSMSGFVETRLADLPWPEKPAPTFAEERLKKIAASSAVPKPAPAPKPVPVVTPGVPTAAEIKKQLEPPPTPIKKVEPKEPVKPTLPPSKIFTF